MSKLIGKAVDRVDGQLKVTGTAKYAAEFSLPQLAHAVILQSTIAKGRIRNINTQAAEKLPGVLAIITHLNAPKLNEIPDDLKPTEGKIGQKLIPLQTETIHYCGQQIGVIIAETLEQASYAASLVEVDYEQSEPVVDMTEPLLEAHCPNDFLGKGSDNARGDVEAGLARADVRIESTYTTPIEHNNPIEPSATIATWDGDQLTLYDSTQGVSSTGVIVATVLGIPPSNVRVISPFLGGGFGCKSFTWPHTFLTAMASRHVNRPVKLVLTRQQMFTAIGYRPRTVQQIAIGATSDGKLTAIRHESKNQTATYEDFTETCGSQSAILYACPNVSVTHRVVSVDMGKPTIMRAPGEASGSFALESAMDELAYTLNIDPLELRLRNYAEKDQKKNLPWSSKSLHECYRQGAERFGWTSRNPEVRSMRDGDMLIGQGMATTVYQVFRRPATATVQILADGSVRGMSGTQDIGTGTYTIMAQIIANALNISTEKVQFDLGDTKLPKAPTSDGSSTAASAGSAVYLAAQKVGSQLIDKAIKDPASVLYPTFRTPTVTIGNY
jgi:xanthine dehydrogenase YagR molybdenum-binding subunit